VLTIGVQYVIIKTVKEDSKFKEVWKMTIEEIRNIIEKAEYDYIGIRADSRDYQIGEVMDNSHQLFQDPQYTDFECTELLYPYISEGSYAGFYDGGELDGTCALEVSENNIEEMIETVKSYGEKIYLIGGNTMEYGNDVDEIIIRNAEVIAVL
jgi:hypothetical protein